MDIFLGLEWVPIVMLRTGKITVTLKTVEGLMRAKLYNLNSGLIVRILDILGLTQS